MSELYEVPLPVTIGASQIGDPKKPGSRVSGAPSQKYPILRDLAESPARITIELDTETRRYTGVIKVIRESSNPSITIDRHNVALKQIIAFRVLKVEVAELPAVL